MKTYNAILAVPNIRGGGEFGGEWHRAGSRENKVCVQLPYIPDRTWTSLSLIGEHFWWFHWCCVCLPLFYYHDLAGSREAFSHSSQYLVKNKYAGPGKVAITGASNGGELTPASLFSTRYSRHDYEIGFLVCGSVVRAPEGTFGAAIAEGGVADILKVIKLGWSLFIL